MTECPFTHLVRTTVWLRLQSYSVKLLAIVLVYWRFGVGNHSHFWSKTVFSAQATFTTLTTGPLFYWTGNNNKQTYVFKDVCGKQLCCTRLLTYFITQIDI